MKKRKLNLLIGALSITLMSILFVGCSGNNDLSSKKSSSAQKVQNKNSGTITAIGSTALKPLVEEVSKNFNIKYPNATINVQGGGSGTGLNQIADGNCDIGNSDVLADAKIKDQTKLKELIDHKVCGIGFAIVTSKDVTVDSLTKEQIQKIFLGEVTNWKQIGGSDKPINVINRSASSGTRATFIETIMNGKKEKQGLGTVQDSSGAVRTSIKSTEGAISYLALSFLGEKSGSVRKDVKLININGIEATTENIVSKKYLFWSYEHMYTKGEAQGLAKEFLTYMISDENDKLIEKLGYIPMSKLK